MSHDAPRPSLSLSGPMARHRAGTWRLRRSGAAADAPLLNLQLSFENGLTLIVRPAPSLEGESGWAFTIEIHDAGRSLTEFFLTSVLPGPGRDPEAGRFPAHDLLQLIERVDALRPEGER